MRVTGLTLVELLIGMTLLSLAAFAAVKVFEKFALWQGRGQITDRTQQELRNLGFALQAQMEGTRSFQSLSFRVPGTKLECRATGFCVKPDSDFSAPPPRETI